MKHQNTEKWGKETAKTRYGTAKGGSLACSDDCQKPQDPIDQHGANYDNDAPKNWLRGMGKNHAEGYPPFDKGREGKI